MNSHDLGAKFSAQARLLHVYVAGPMTGIPDFNFPAFNAEAAKLRDVGFWVENPAEHGIWEGAEWQDYLRYDLTRLALCDQIHLLPGWSKSKGARLEMHIAKALGMLVSYADGAEIVPAGEREAIVAATSTIDPSEVRRLDGIREGWEAYAAWQRTQAAGVPEGWRLVGYTTAGMLSIAEQLPLTGRIGARCKADHRWNVPLYVPTKAQDLADESWLAYTDPEATPEENTVRQVSALVAGKAFNEVCMMLGGRWPDAKLEQEAPTAHRFFMELIGAAAPAQPAAHPDDAAVDRFAAAMKAKLAKAREKGRGGWDDPAQCSAEFLAKLLIEHLTKGNAGTFEDVANFAMMLHQRDADPKVLAKAAAQEDLAALFAEVERLQALVRQQGGTAQSAPDEVFAIPVRENGKRTTVYTEVLPFVPGPGVEVLGDPVRMVAAQSAPVENDAFVPGSLADLLFQLGEKGVSVSGGTHGDRWRVRLPRTVAAQSAPAGEREAFEVEIPDISAIYDGRSFIPYRSLEAGERLMTVEQHLRIEKQLRAALTRPAQTEQQPVAWIVPDFGFLFPTQEAASRYLKNIEDPREPRAVCAAPAQPASPAQSEKVAHSAQWPTTPGLSARPSEVHRLREALEHARLFIRNGINLGYIRMPDADTPDPAHETLPMIDAALAASTGQEVGEQQIDGAMKLPCEVKLPGGPTIGKGCTLSTLLLALRNRGDDMPWRQRFGMAAPFDPRLVNMVAALSAQQGEGGGK